MKQKFEKFKAKLKNEKKFRTRFISVMVVSVVIIACAVTIPVELHNRVNVEAETESVAITAEAVLTESASVMITESETEVTSEITTEPTTAETTAQAANNAGAGNNTPANTNKGGGSNKSGGSDSSAQKPNGGSSGGQSQQETPVATPQKENYDWSQAEVDALIAEAYAYGRTLGLEPATNLTPSNSSWNQPVCTWLGKQNTIDGVKSEIRHLKWLLDRDGLDPTGIPCYQIYAERYCEVNAGGLWCWQFYVMY